MKSIIVVTSKAMCLFLIAVCPVVEAGMPNEPSEHAAEAGLPQSRIEIRDFMFKPAQLTVTAGTTVTFVNRDEEPHVVASADGKFQKSGPLDTDQRFTVTLTHPGVYAYFARCIPT